MRRPKVLAPLAGLAAAAVTIGLELADARWLVLVLVAAAVATTLGWLVAQQGTQRLERQVASLDARQAAGLESLRREVARLREERGRQPDDR